MKQILALAALLSLAACSQQPIPRAVITPAQINAVAAVLNPTITPDPVVTPAPAPTPAPVVEKASIQTTAIPAVRSPGSGLNCSGVAGEYIKDLTVWVRSANCGDAGTANVTITFDGQTTRGVIGSQDLIVAQVLGGFNVPVTATIRVNGFIVWPHGHEFDPPAKF